MIQTLNPSQMALRKWANMSTEQQVAHIKKMQRGRKKLWDSLTPEQQKKQMKKVRAAAKANKKKRKTH